MRIKTWIALIILTAGTAFAAEADEQTRFSTYKTSILKHPALIRFYTFEEGQGQEVTNHVLLDPAQRAFTGGTLGSLTIQRQINSDTDVAETDFDFVPPAWTQGRWPWKAAVTNGRDIAPYPWQVTKLFRSGITGAEFAEGMTLTTWIRFHESSDGVSNIITLGNGFNTGIMLSYSKRSQSDTGYVQFKLGITEGQRANLGAGGIVPGTWNHIAVTLDGELATLYFNGKQVDQKPNTAVIIPTTFQDYPLVGPFHEASSPTRWGEFMMIGHNVYKEKNVNLFDMDELALYSQGIEAEAIAKLYESGKPSSSADEQLAEFRRLKAERDLLATVNLSVPNTTSGYFRIGEKIPVTIDIPIAPGLSGDFTAEIAVEDLYGKPIETITRPASAGKPLQVDLVPPACMIYYINITVRQPSGSILKTLPEKYCVAVVPPAPQSLTEHNPVALWADHFTNWHFDAPIRRMNYLIGKPERFLNNYAAYDARIPNFRSYVWFYYNSASTDEARAANRAMFTEAAGLFKDRNVFGIELSSEPHTKNVDTYVTMLKDATEIIRPAKPGIQFFPPGGSPSEIPLIAAILKKGGAEMVDGVSFHPYTSNPIGTYLWSSLTARLKKVLALYPDKNLSMWNTEGGVNSLPRMGDRPMTRQDAHAARFRFGNLYGHQYFHYFISMVPEDEAAAIQCHAILMDLYQGYQVYTLCQRPHLDGKPTLRGISLTALAGQILNHQVGVDRLPLAAVENMCLLVRQDDGSTIAAIFSMQPSTINLQVAANATYKTMDVLGNFSTITANNDGLITVTSGKNPLYIFGVPDDMSEVVPLTLTAPEDLPDNGILNATVTVHNPFSTPLTGVLSAPDIVGASIALSKQDITLAPGKTETIRLTLTGEQLKRKKYLLSTDLREQADTESKLIASSQRVFYSPGVIQKVRQIATPIILDGKADEWTDIPATIGDDPDSLAHGKPNHAEMWVPQWINSDDLSIKVQTAWRKGDGVYFLLTVRDDVLVPAPEDKVGMAFRYDCLEFFFDSRIYGEQGTAISPGADQVVVVPSIGDEPTDCVNWHARKGKNHVDFTAIGRKIDGGYIIEGKVVPNDRSQFRVQAGSQFRMDFLIDDADSLEAKLLRKAAMVLHGGMTNAQNSDIWGRYELSLEAK